MVGSQVALPFVALTTLAVDNNVASSVTALNPNTTVLEISAQGVAIATSALQASATGAGSFVGADGAGAIVVEGAFQGSASGVAEFVGEQIVVTTFDATSGYNPWQMAEMRRLEALALDDMEILELMREALPHYGHQRVGLRAFSRSSSKVRSPSLR